MPWLASASGSPRDSSHRGKTAGSLGPCHVSLVRPDRGVLTYQVGDVTGVIVNMAGFD